MTRIMLTCFFYGALLFLAGCRNKAALDANGVPRTLLVAVYGGDNPTDGKLLREGVRQYLEKKLGVRVELVVSTDYSSVIVAIQTKKVHLAYLSPFSYVIASQKTSLVPLVMLGRNNKPAMYKSIIIGNPKTGIKNIEDLKARAKGLTLCFADPASTSGHLIPRAYLSSIGLDPETAFKETLFAGSHPASVLSVKSGKIDIGCTSEYALDMMIRHGALNKGDVTVLWTSDPIVDDCIAIRSEINPEFARKVQQAYLSLPTEAPAVWKAYISRFNLRSDTVSYMVANDSFYNGLRKIASGVKDLHMPVK